jgi:hypothetical protein
MFNGIFFQAPQIVPMQRGGWWGGIAYASGSDRAAIKITVDCFTIVGRIHF